MTHDCHVVLLLCIVSEEMRQHMMSPWRWGESKCHGVPECRDVDPNQRP